MADIKLTLSTDQRKRSPSIEAEREWLMKEGRLWYPLGRHRPQRLAPGDWIYFIRAGQLVARARIESIDPPSGDPKWSYRDQDTNGGSWEAAITSMELAIRRLPHRGFQGFRYVTPAESDGFAAAFAIDDPPPAMTAGEGPETGKDRSREEDPPVGDTSPILPGVGP